MHAECPVVSDSLRPQGLSPTRLLCLWDFPARIQEWVDISSSRGFSQPRNWTQVCYVGRRVLYHWTTLEAPLKTQRKISFILKLVFFSSVENSSTILSADAETPPGSLPLSRPVLSACNYTPPSPRSSKGQFLGSIKAGAEWPQIVPATFTPSFPGSHLSFAPVWAKPALTRPTWT